MMVADGEIRHSGHIVQVPPRVLRGWDGDEPTGLPDSVYEVVYTQCRGSMPREVSVSNAKDSAARSILQRSFLRAVQPRDEAVSSLQICREKEGRDASASARPSDIYTQGAMTVVVNDGRTIPIATFCGCGCGM